MELFRSVPVPSLHQFCWLRKRMKDGDFVLTTNT
uniref:Uncharacterized protein n=1 Tax=Arundo donax TaxID=35708 RepID=A0A0A9BN58_ARUDO